MGFFFAEYKTAIRIRGHMTDISSFALITSSFKEALTNKILAKRKRSFLHVYVYCIALRNPLRHSFSLNFFERLRKAVRVKKRHIFLANLKRILKHSLSVREIFLV